MDFRGGVGVSRFISSPSRAELAEFSSSEQLGDGEPVFEASEEITPLTLCFFFRLRLSGLPDELTSALVKIDRLYVFLMGVREDDLVRMTVMGGHLSFSMHTTGL